MPSSELSTKIIENKNVQSILNISAVQNFDCNYSIDKFELQQVNVNLKFIQCAQSKFFSAHFKRKLV